MYVCILCVCWQPQKPKLGLVESFRVLWKSEYLGYLATLVLGYGLCINMTEGEGSAACSMIKMRAFGEVVFKEGRRRRGGGGRGMLNAHLASDKTVLNTLNCTEFSLRYECYTIFQCRALRMSFG